MPYNDWTLYISIINIQKIKVLHNLVSTSYCQTLILVILVDKSCYLIVVLMCSYLMTSNVELFSCAICKSFVKYLKLLHLLFGLFEFLLLSCKSSFYILDTSPLSDICSINIFSQSVTCLIFLVIFLEKQEILTLIKSNFSNLFCVLWFSLNLF